MSAMDPQQLRYKDTVKILEKNSNRNCKSSTLSVHLIQQSNKDIGLGS